MVVSHTLRIHLQGLHFRTRSIHPKSDPPDAAFGRFLFVRFAAEHAALPALKNLIDAQCRDKAVPLPEFLASEIGAHAAQLAKTILNSGLTMVQMSKLIGATNKKTKNAAKYEIADLKRRLDELGEETAKT